jgi:hypothetical protein
MNKNSSRDNWPVTIDIIVCHGQVVGTADSCFEGPVFRGSFRHRQHRLLPRASHKHMLYRVIRALHYTNLYKRGLASPCLPRASHNLKLPLPVFTSQSIYQLYWLQVFCGCWDSTLNQVIIASSHWFSSSFFTDSVDIESYNLQNWSSIVNQGLSHLQTLTFDDWILKFKIFVVDFAYNWVI